MIARLFSLVVLLAPSLFAQVSPRAAPAFCGLAFRVTDADTGAPLAGAGVLFVPFNVAASADSRGLVVWNVPSSRENFWTQGKPFEIAAAAPGYALFRRTFTTPQPYRGDCPSCDQGMSLFSFDVPLRAITSLGNVGPVFREVDTVSSITYEYKGHKPKPCCEGPARGCVDVIQGCPAGTIDLTGANKQIETSTISATFELGGGLFDLAGFGFTAKSESKAEKSLVIDAVVGNRNQAPELCGSLCIRDLVEVFTWEKWETIQGRAYFRGSVNLEARTGVCVSAAGLHKCTDTGNFDSCGKKL